MGNRIRGTIAILVGAFGLFRSYQLFHRGMPGWTPWLMLAAGVVLILLGALRLRPERGDAGDELLR
ncbi:MAG TPA: hypothetical protein VHZ52_06400 [Acidobacteriaceae bacterium]|jgi:hypothetical protein|nr:hypothetical protein [Acidobacteriaceae bacterium]